MKLDEEQPIQSRMVNGNKEQRNSRSQSWTTYFSDSGVCPVREGDVGRSNAVAALVTERVGEEGIEVH